MVWGESPWLPGALGGLGAVQGCVLPGQDHLHAQMAGGCEPGISCEAIVVAQGSHHGVFRAG